MAELVTFKCILGIHTYEPYKEVEIKNTRGEIEALNIISKCKTCGKLKDHVVPVMSNRY